MRRCHGRPLTLAPLRRSVPLLAVLLPAAVAAGCGEEEAPAVRVDGVTYSRNQVLGFSHDRLELLGELAAFGLAVADGETDELLDPLVERRRLELLAELLHVDRALDTLGVSDEMLRARYRSDPELELTVRHLIVLSDRKEPDETRAEARAKAVRALERIRAGEAFPEVAAEVSEEPGAEGREGLLQPGREGAWVPEFWNAARSLDVGEISDVVETQYGFHVLRLEERDTVPFEEARSGELLEAARLMNLTWEPEDPVVSVPGELRLEGDALSRIRSAAAPDSLVVATWHGGTLSLGSLRDHLATLERERWQEVVAAPTDDLERMVEEVAALHMAADSARARGLGAPEARLADFRRPWRQRLDRWAAGLAFTPGRGPEAVAESALEAMGATGQEATIARSEIHESAPLLHRVYDIHVAGGEESAAGQEGVGGEQSVETSVRLSGDPGKHDGAVRRRTGCWTSSEPGRRRTRG